MTILDVEQHSPEWFTARLGHVTASKVAAIREKKRGVGELEARKTLRYQLLAEILKKRTTEHYVSPYMDWGIEQEPNAKAEYEYRTGYNLKNIGFVLHPTLPRCGASPDGWIQPDGFAEFKCLETHNHLAALDGGVIPEEWLPQLYWQMACAGPEIKWIDWVAYDPRVDEKFQMFICRLDRDEEKIAKMESDVEKFIVELNGMAERMLNNATFVTRESKLRESIRRAGKYPFASEEEERAFHDTVVP